MPPAEWDDLVRATALTAQPLSDFAMPRRLLTGAAPSTTRPTELSNYTLAYPKTPSARVDTY